MKLKDFNTEEHFKQSFKKVFGEDIDISLDTTFGELEEWLRNNKAYIDNEIRWCMGLKNNEVDEDN